MIELVNPVEKIIQSVEVGNNIDIDVDIPEEFTKELYIIIFRRITCDIRYLMYKKTKEKGIHRKLLAEEVKSIMNEISSAKITDMICAKYNIKKSEDDIYVLLLERVYYFFLFNQEFTTETDNIKSDNQILTLAILDGGSIPEMDKDPEEMSDEELDVS